MALMVPRWEGEMRKRSAWDDALCASGVTAFLQTEAGLGSQTTGATRGKNLHEETHRKAPAPAMMSSQR